MTNKKNTRRALFTSIMSLILCFAMLMGTTFAWFTDEVINKGNKIASGNLDIELHELGKDNVWKDISASNDPLFYPAKWEPGFTMSTVLKVVNKGTLALNWAASVNAITKENVTVLADVIDVYVKEGVTSYPDSFADIQGSYTRVGTLRDFMGGFAANTVGVLYPAGDQKGPSEATLGITLHMQEEAGNTYQNMSLGSEFDIRILATQLSHEMDSFGDGYDATSKYPADYTVTKNVPVIVEKDADNNVISAKVENEQKFELGTQTNADITQASVTVPAGASVKLDAIKEDGTVDLTPSVKVEDTVPEGIVIADDEAAIPLEIKVAGLASDNTAVVTVYTNIGAGRNDVMLYHNGSEMDGVAPADNSFTYDRTTGDLYIYSTSFSPFTVVYESLYDAVIGSVNYATLQDAVDAVQNGQIITLQKNVNYDVTVTQQSNVKFTINGNGKTYNGVITVDGKSARYEGAGVTIKNTHFNADELSADAFIRLGHVDAARYTNNVTVSNCTFSGTDNKTVAVKSYTGGDWNLTIDGCTVDAGMHSLAQLKNVEQNLIVKNCTVASKNGLNVNNGTNLFMTNCNFDVQGYAVRFGESDNTTDENFTIENSTLKAGCTDSDDAVIVFRKGAVNATLNLNNTTLNGTREFYGNTADTIILVNGYVEATSADELVAGLENKQDVKLLNDIKIDPANMSNAYGKTGINVKNGQTIDGANHTLDIKGAGGTWDSGINTTGGLIKNIKVTGSFRGIFINHNSSYSEKVVLEDVIIDGTTYTISCDEGLYQNLEATNCTFNGWTSYAKTIGNVKFVDCNFGAGSGYKFCRPYAPTEFVGCDFCEGYKVDPCAAVTFENCTINGVALTAENLDTLVTSNITNASVK